MDGLFTPDMDSENEMIPTKEEFVKFSLQYQQMIMLYENAIRCITMRLEIMENEYNANGWHMAIRSISSRIKQPVSINRKLEKLGVPISLKAIHNYLNDVAGIRIICDYLSDIYIHSAGYAGRQKTYRISDRKGLYQKFKIERLPKPAFDCRCS